MYCWNIFKILDALGHALILIESSRVGFVFDLFKVTRIILDFMFDL